MANALGRISGQLLKDDLTRNGTDLKFDEFGSTDPLLYLDVTARRISVNTDVRSRDLLINGKTITSNLISTNGLINLSTLELGISGDQIISSNGINIIASSQVNANVIETDNLRIDGNTIYSVAATNAPIEIRPSGIGELNINSNTNITGNLRAYDIGPNTGNITIDGNITFGSNSADSVSFASDINSNIIPDINEFYNIGSNPATGGARWDVVYPNLVNGTEITVGSIASSGLDLSLRQGSIWYVAANGSDTNVGNHQNGPFATIEHALSVATTGDTVYIYPGTYVEITPLVIPVGVTVRGAGIRSVTIVPDITTQSENVFLLNGETTVSDLSIKDFYQPGYAFSFNLGFTVSSRSPYIQNVTVITHGSVTSANDPRGFDQADAGGGAYIDGSLASAVSKEASMLFHSVTFITPNADAVVMLNGVRVEWLNSFTYFANRGLYAIDGTAGLSSLGIRFGAEIRSIGSANVYGNYGAEANGASTLMYLITHNFAYIGAGKDVTNDPSLNIVENETVEIASGKIYYQSVDNKGNFKVGDAFGVSFETGLVTISGVSVSAGGVTSINFANGTDETVINALEVVTGNIKFSSNNLTSLNGDITLSGGTGEINFNTDLNALQNLTINGNFNIDRKLTIGNAYIDVVRFTAPVEFDLRPVSDDDFTLGGPTNKSWDFVYLDTAYIGSYKLENATISSLPVNSDVELRANSTGKIYIPTNNVEIDSNLTVNAVTTLKNTEVTGTLTQFGDYYQTGNTLQTGNRTISGTLDVTSGMYFDNINIVNNRIFTTNANDNLQLEAAGTGKVHLNEIVRIDQAATINVVESAGITNSGTITSGTFTDSDITISSNLITTTVTDSDLELKANTTGKVNAPLDPVVIDLDLTVVDDAILKNTTINASLDHIGNTVQVGSVLHTGNFDITGNLTVTGTNAFFKNVRIINNTVSTSLLNSNLNLQASGSGIIAINDSALFSQQLTVSGTTYTNGIINSGTITTNEFRNGDILIDDNFITTTVGNNNLVLLGSSTGGPKLEKIKFDNSIISTESGNDSIVITTPASSVLVNTSSALKIPAGTTANRSSLIQGDVRFNTSNNLFNGFSSARVTFGGIYSQNQLTKATAHPTNNTVTFTVNNATAMTVSATGLNINGLLVDNNLLFNNSTISTSSNADVYFSPNGTGYVKIDDIAIRANEILNLSNQPIILQNTNSGYIKFGGTAGLAIPAGDNASRPLTPETGDLRWNTELSEAEVFNGIAYQALSGSGGDLLSAAEVQEETNLWALVLG